MNMKNKKPRQLYHFIRVLAPLKILPFKRAITNRRGQTLVEFVLLLMVVMMMSIVMLKVSNGKISQQWTAIVDKVVNQPGTPPGDLELVELR